VVISKTVDGERSQRVGDDAEDKDHRRWVSVVEVTEVILLAVVALATAWSGYQASKWDGRQTHFYGLSQAQHFQANAASVFGSQELAANSAIFTAWLQARAENNLQLQSQYVARFTRDYKYAFDAWVATDPFTNPQAPAGPANMPQYNNPYLSQASRLNAEAAKTFDQGTSARDTSDKYVRYTVLLASVLFLIALAQRLRFRSARIGLNVVAFGILVYAITEVLTLPRL
jgi:hypothetical protein